MNIETTREWMINHQVRPWNVIDQDVLATLGAIKREQFVPEPYRELAFVDTEIPLPCGQRMLKPVVEGRLLQALQLRGSHDVLVVGTGSGYLTACIAALAGNVTAIDVHDELTHHAQTALALARVGNTHLQTADFVTFEPVHAFDRIVVTAALPAFDERLAEWLKPGGRALAAIGEAPSMEVEAIVRDDDQYRREALFETVLPMLENVGKPAAFEF